MDAADLLQAVKLWAEKRSAREQLCRERAADLAAAILSLRERTPDIGIDDVAPLARHIAVAVGRGFLKSASDSSASASEHEPLDTVLDRIVWDDMVFAAACVAKNERANSELIALVKQEVFPILIKRFGRARANSVCEELPSRLHVNSETGLNRGRPRLLAYSGRSSLVAWLRTVAINRCRDEHKKDDPVAGGLDEMGGQKDISTADPQTAASRSESLRLLMPIVQDAFPDLMRELQDSSPAQYRYAYLRCVKRMRHVDIAQQLDVGKPRVSQLSEAVCGKLMVRIDQAAPDLQVAGGRMDPKNRAILEEALQEWFGEEDLTATADALEDDSAMERQA